jgi:hypothetical protein
MSSGPKYGHLIGDGHGVRRTLTVSEVYAEQGGHLVCDAGSGTVGLVDATSDKIIGWAVVGKLTGWGSNYFTATATSDALVINDADDVFRMPATSAVTTADEGKMYHIAYSGSGVTGTNFIQRVHNTGTTSSTGPLLVVKVNQDDIDNQTMQVKILY